MDCKIAFRCLIVGRFYQRIVTHFGVYCLVQHWFLVVYEYQFVYATPYFHHSFQLFEMERKPSFDMKNSIRAERLLINITQGELATLTQVSRQNINAIETGKYLPSTVLAMKIARVFGKSVEAVFTLEETD